MRVLCGNFSHLTCSFKSQGPSDIESIQIQIQVAGVDMNSSKEVPRTPRHRGRGFSSATDVNSSVLENICKEGASGGSVG